MVVRIGARRPPWRVEDLEYSPRYAVLEEGRDHPVARFYREADAALAASAVNRAEHDAAGAEPPKAPHSIEQIGFFRGPIFGCSCGKTQMDQAEAWQHATEVSGTAKEGFVPVAAPVAACPEPAGEVEREPGELRKCPFCDGRAQRYDAEDGGSAIECSRCHASTALHFDRKENLASSWNDRAALARRPAEDQVYALAQAMSQLLDDMGANGLCVCLAAKKEAWEAFEPFNREPYTDDPLPAPPRDEGGER